MKFGARYYCAFALFACLCLTSSRVYSDEHASDQDYSILTKGSGEDRETLKILNDLLKKAYEGRDVVRNWSDAYSAQERKTKKEVVGLFSKFNESERNQLAQDLKKGKLSEAFRGRLDAQEFFSSFQRLETERGFLKKIQTLDERLSSKIIEAESKREILAKRIVADVRDDGIRQKEEVIDELSKILDDANRKLDAWKENETQKQKGELIDQIVNDSKAKEKKGRKQKGASKTEESSADDSIQGWKPTSQQVEQQESEVESVQNQVVVEVEDGNLEGQAVDSNEDQNIEESDLKDDNFEAQDVLADENAEAQEGLADKNSEVKDALEDEKSEVKDALEDEKSEAKDALEGEKSEAKDALEDKKSEELNLGQGQESQEELAPFEFVPLQALDEDDFLEQKTEEKDVDYSEEPKITPQTDEEPVKFEERNEPQEETYGESKATEDACSNVENIKKTKVENISDLASSVPSRSSKVVTGDELRSASKSSTSPTSKSSNQRQTISVGNVEIAFRLCPSSDQNADEEFWIQETETTQEQWFAVGAKTTKTCYFKGAKLPVENVDWNACVGFVKKLNESNVAPEGWMFTIPTAAQWERAWKLGKSGDDLASLVEYAWFGENSDKKTHEVATKKPDALGLYDMSGNVWEWTRSTDATGKALVVRGASWNNLPENGALVDSFNCAAQTRGNNLGLRLVLVRKPLVAAPNARKILR